MIGSGQIVEQPVATVHSYHYRDNGRRGNQGANTVHRDRAQPCGNNQGSKHSVVIIRVTQCGNNQGNEGAERRFPVPSGPPWEPGGNLLMGNNESQKIFEKTNNLRIAVNHPLHRRKILGQGYDTHGFVKVLKIVRPLV